MEGDGEDLCSLVMLKSIYRAGDALISFSQMLAAGSE
jgi:hypothetical protein